MALSNPRKDALRSVEPDRITFVPRRFELQAASFHLQGTGRLHAHRLAALQRRHDFLDDLVDQLSRLCTRNVHLAAHSIGKVRAGNRASHSSPIKIFRRRTAQSGPLTALFVTDR